MSVCTCRPILYIRVEVDTATVTRWKRHIRSPSRIRNGLTSNTRTDGRTDNNGQQRTDEWMRGLTIHGRTNGPMDNKGRTDRRTDRGNVILSIFYSHTRGKFVKIRQLNF